MSGMQLGFARQIGGRPCELGGQPSYRVYKSRKAEREASFESAER